ncbi:hypothetical protein AAAC51_29650 [Priestia megaterium]
MDELIGIALELFIGFICLFILTKFLGRATITQLTTFDFISALVLGELVGNALYDSEVGIGKILFAVIFWERLFMSPKLLLKKYSPAFVFRRTAIYYYSKRENFVQRT